MKVKEACIKLGVTDPSKCHYLFSKNRGVWLLDRSHRPGMLACRRPACAAHNKQRSSAISCNHDAAGGTRSLDLPSDSKCWPFTRLDTLLTPSSAPAIDTPRPESSSSHPKPKFPDTTSAHRCPRLSFLPSTTPAADACNHMYIDTQRCSFSLREAASRRPR